MPKTILSEVEYYNIAIDKYKEKEYNILKSVFKLMKDNKIEINKRIII